MSASSQSLFSVYRLSLSYWLALSAALVAFSIVSGNLIFSLVIATGSIFRQCLDPKASNRIRTIFTFLFTFGTYLYALHPLWSSSYTEYFGIPLAALLTVALLAAFNRYSFGGSRGFTCIASVAFFLFLRNVLIYYEYQAPIDEIAQAIAFISLMEIGITNRYQNDDERPHPELGFGLLLALIASFHFTSWVLGLFLAGLPVVAYLIRNHKLAEVPNEHTRPATLATHGQSGPFYFKPVLALLPLLLAALLYLLLLRIPFWSEEIPRNAPPVTKLLSEKAKIISDAADLETDTFQSIADDLVNQEYIKEKAQQFAQKLQSLPRNKRSEQTPPTETETEYDAINRSEYEGNPSIAQQTPRRKTERFGPTVGENLTLPSPASGPTSASPEPQTYTSREIITPPRASVGSGTPKELRTFEFERNLPIDSALLDFQTEESGSVSQSAQTLNDAPRFEEFLGDFDSPARAMSQTLNLEGSNISSLLDEKPLLTVKLESKSNLPKRLYLRSNVMDTVRDDSFGGSQSNDGTVQLDSSDNKRVNLFSFKTSSKLGSDVSITSGQLLGASLPVPDSFSAIQIFDADSIQANPEDRILSAPRVSDSITYRLFNVDFDTTASEYSADKPTKVYSDRMLGVPLPRKDRNYLQRLAKKVGGSQTSTALFARRFSNYFQQKHPYSYFVTIPEGDEHAVVRWLKNERPGLCSNYAAAFTLLARSRGIPTRVVSGFASDEYRSQDNRYIVRQNNAHAWVEYLDESNRWIRFDPTPRISEAEMRRAQDYVTPAPERSLASLIESEQTNIDSTDTSNPSLEALADTATAFEQDPQVPEPNVAQPDLPAGAKETKPRPEVLAEVLDSLVSRNSPTDTTAPPTEEFVDPIEIPQDNLQANNATVPPPIEETPPQVAPTSEKDRLAPRSTSPPWLLFLVLLALAIPISAKLFSNSRHTHSIPKQMRTRHEAGKLLAQLDTLLEQHNLFNDPVWNETRNTLTEQRYGRETNDMLVKDIAVKIRLLAKRKPGKS